MSEKRIYIDLDDVICETARGFLEVLRADFGKDVEFDAIHAFDLGVSLGLDRVELQAFMEAVHEPEVLLAMAPIAGAVEVLDEWRAAGHELRVVTGRPPESLDVSRRWLAEWEVPYDGLTFVDKYSRELPDWTETSVVKLDDLVDEGFAFAVEDSLEVAKRLAGELGFQVLLMDRPWNQTAPGDVETLDGKLVRCRSWEDIRRWEQQGAIANR